MSDRPGRRYRTAAAFRRALDDRLKAQARAEGVLVGNLRRRFLLECYLARIFSLPGDHWVLKGGSGLAVRLPGARHTKDLDLCHLHDQADADACIHALRAAGRQDERDPFVFTVTNHARMTGLGGGYKLSVECTLGGRVYETFQIDLTFNLDFIGEVEILERALPVQIGDIQSPPPIRLYPMVDQVADKVAAMYERHAGHPSTRYRDLVDLVLIAQSGRTLDLAPLIAALRFQEVRRSITLPDRLTPPEPTWATNYPAEASRAKVESDLSAALEIAGQLVNPALHSLRRI